MTVGQVAERGGLIIKLRIWDPHVLQPDPERPPLSAT